MLLPPLFARRDSGRLARVAAFSMLLAGAARAAPADDGPPPVTPYRPSVSSPAQLPAPGQLEMELGGLAQRDDGARRNSLPYAFKLAFNEHWGVVLGGEAYVGARDADGASARGVGDTTFILKRAFAVDESTAFGLELGAKAPTARDDIGSGYADYSVNGIFSRDLGAVHMDANLNLSRIGGTEPGSGRTQTGLSAAFSMPVNEQWGASAELSGNRRRGTGGVAQLLLAAAYSPSKRLTFDVGMARGLTPAAPNWSLFTGVVLPLAKLW